MRISTRVSDLLVLSIVAFNAMVGSARTIVADEGWALAAGDLFGVSAVVWIALGLAAFRLRRAAAKGQVPAWQALLVSILCLVPSAQVAWLAGTIYFLARLVQDRGNTAVPHAGLLIALALCARTPVTWMLTTLFAEPLLQFDAVLAGWLASQTTLIAGIEGNVVVHESGHRLFVMTGCSSWNNLSLALLFWFAMTRGLMADGTRPPLWYPTMVGASVVLINVARLSIMARSPEAYHWLHDGDGAEIVLLLTAFTVGALTFFSLRGGRHAHPVA